MNLIKKIQHRVGVALTASEHYERAFAQGVLLGPDKFARAADLFEVAAERAQRESAGELQQRARANAGLYRYLGTGAPASLLAVHEALGPLSQIERIGSQREQQDAQQLRLELAGRLAEYKLASLDLTDHKGRARVHEAAARAFLELLGSRLQTYDHQPDAIGLVEAEHRAFFHEGLARHNDSLALARRDPAGAAELMTRAIAALHQTPAQAQQTNSEQWLERLRTRRSCWLCDREFSGAGIHFRSLPATVLEHVAEVLQRAGQDRESASVAGQSVVVCTTCSSALHLLADAQAKRRVDELRAEVGQTLTHLQHQINALDRRLSALAALR